MIYFIPNSKAKDLLDMIHNKFDVTILCDESTLAKLPAIENHTVVVYTNNKKKYANQFHTTDCRNDFVRLWEEYSLERTLYVISSDI